MSRSNQFTGAACAMLALLSVNGFCQQPAQQPVWTKPAPAADPSNPVPQQPAAPTPPPAAAPAPATPAPATSAPAPPPVAAPPQTAPVGAEAQQSAATPAQTQEPVAPAAIATPAAKYPNHYVPVAGKKGKFEYVGPKSVVELAPTPMLDEEGRQRLDPDGKPMFNPPVRQQRDKHGNPLFDEQGKPVMQTPGEMGYDENGKKIHDKKEKPPKMVSVSIERGTLTIDGMTGKAGLNYEIKDLKYIYLYAPWIGVTIVSTSPFPGAREQKDAFKEHTLTVNVEDHTLQLYSDKQMLGKKPESAFVAVDRNFKLPAKFPVVGYGETTKAPYVWPGSHENASLKGPVAPPPLPASLRPVTLLQPCPAGQMRMPGKTPLPGETAPPQPCVPIGKALPGVGTPQSGSLPPPAPSPAAPVGNSSAPVPQPQT